MLNKIIVRVIAGVIVTGLTAVVTQFIRSRRQTTES